MPAEKEKHADIKAMSFEEALKELEQIVRDLEKGTQELDKAIAQYERGTALRQHCEARLQEARLKVEKIVRQADGSIAAEPFETEKS